MRAWIIIVLAAIFSVSNALAASVEVTVAKRGKDATEARELAIFDAEQKAFRKLLIEKVPARAEAILSSYEPSHISALVQGYEVLDERMTDTSYRATLRMSFNDAIIDQMTRLPAAAGSAPLEDVPLPPGVESHREAILVMPVFRDERGIMLWDEDNQWRSWMNEAALVGKGKLVMPFGDPTDRLMIDSGNVTTASYGLLAPLAERYGAQSIIVAIAEPVYQAVPPMVNVTLRYLAPGAISERQIVLEDQQVGRALKAGAYAVIENILTEKQREIEEANTVPLIHLDARMDFSRMQDWVAAKRRMQQIPEIEAIVENSADWNGMEFQLAFRGTPEELGMALRQVDIRATKGDELLLIGLR